MDCLHGQCQVTKSPFFHFPYYCPNTQPASTPSLLHKNIFLSSYNCIQSAPAFETKSRQAHEHIRINIAIMMMELQRHIKSVAHLKYSKIPYYIACKSRRRSESRSNGDFFLFRNEASHRECRYSDQVLIIFISTLAPEKYSLIGLPYQEG
jgi:hypothetical protein